MNFRLIIHSVSILVVIIALFMLFPLFIALGRAEDWSAFALPIIFALITGTSLFFLTKEKSQRKFRNRDGFMMVALSWVLASLLGAMPFWLSGAIPSFTDAYFETMSGFTTTGASILTEIEGLPDSILFWRSLTHWLGGMGIVVLTVAVLPLLGIFGLNLVKAEAPGPSVDKISTKIAGTAKILWIIYLSLTVLETILLKIGGMSLFDALVHTFGTLATGGFSSKNASVGGFDSAFIHNVITVFMVLAGLNFALYFKFFTGKIKDVFKNSEFKAYIGIFFAATLLITFRLNGDVFQSFGESMRYAAFQVASILTTTGYATTDYAQWPSFTKIILFSVMFIGGCAGSTGGGIKVVRIITLFKLAINEMKMILLPRSVFSMKINGEPMRKSAIYSIAGFFFLYIFFLLLTTIVVSTGGSDIVTSFSAALATVGNIGPGFGLIGPANNYAHFNDFIKWFLSFAMMAGRLEIYTVLVLFLPRINKVK